MEREPRKVIDSYFLPVRPRKVIGSYGRKPHIYWEKKRESQPVSIEPRKVIDSYFLPVRPRKVIYSYLRKPNAA